MKTTRNVLEGRKKQKPFRLKQVTFKGKGLHRDAGDGSWEVIRDMIYEGHGAQPVSFTEHS